MTRSIGVAVLGLALLVTVSPTVQAHLGVDDGFSLEGDWETITYALSFLSAAALTIAGFVYLRHRWKEGHEPDATWLLVLLGIAWVVTAVSVPDAWILHPAWVLPSAALIFGTLAAAWACVLPHRHRFWPQLGSDRRALTIGGIAGALFGVFFAVGTHMVRIVPAEEAALAGDRSGYILSYETFGPLAVWPDVEVWWPAVRLGAHATPASAGILVTAVSLFALAIAVLASNFSRGRLGATSGAGAAPVAMNLCACCTPAFYPVLVALFGSAAAPLAYAMSDPELATYNVAQVANLWFLVLAVRVGIRGMGACSPIEDAPASSPSPG